MKAAIEPATARILDELAGRRYSPPYSYDEDVEPLGDRRGDGAPSSRRR